MPPVQDPDGGVWSVHRREWSVRDATETATWGARCVWCRHLVAVAAGRSGVASVAHAKLCGVRWKITVIRDGVEVVTEKVRGKRASDDRVDEIVRNIRSGMGLPRR